MISDNTGRTYSPKEVERQKRQARKDSKNNPNYKYYTTKSVGPVGPAPVQTANLKAKRQEERQERKEERQNKAIANNPTKDFDKDGLINKFDENDRKKIGKNDPARGELKRRQADWLVQRKANRNPVGDVDKDGVVNKYDYDDLRKTTVKPENKYKVAYKRVYLNDGPVLIANDPMARALALEKAKKYGEKDGLSYVVKQDPVSSQYYILRKTEKNNSDYKKKFDADSDGISGEKEDYKILARRAKREQDDNANPGNRRPGDSDDVGNDSPRVGNTGNDSSNSDDNSSNDGSNSGNKKKNNKKGKKMGNGNNDKDDNQQKDYKFIVNGRKLVGAFENLYGDKASENLELAIKNLKASGVEVKQTGKPGQYGFNVLIKTKDGWISNATEIKERLAKHATGIGGEDELSEAQQKQLYVVSGLKTALVNRTARALHGGDIEKANAEIDILIKAYQNKYPNKIKTRKLASGETQILIKTDGDWDSTTDQVMKSLMSVRQDTNPKDDKTGFDSLTRQQKHVLLGANGNAVRRAFAGYYGDMEKGDEALAVAMKKFENSGSGTDIRAHGEPGEKGYFIEVLTKAGWSSSTKDVLKALNKHAPASVGGDSKTDDDKTNSSALAVPNTWGSGGWARPGEWNPLFDEWESVNGAFIKLRAAEKGAKANPNYKKGGTGDPYAITPELRQARQELQVALRNYDKASSGAITKENNAEIRPEVVPQPVYPGGIGNDSDGSTNAETLVAQKRKAELDEFKESKKGSMEVKISHAAEKSKAMMAADLNDNNKISNKEAALFAPADRNDNGVIGSGEARKYAAVADTNDSGRVGVAEARAFNVLDTNNDGRIGTGETKAYKSLDANNDGSITKKEAKETVKDLRAQVDLSKREEKELDLAKAYLAKADKKTGGGGLGVDDQVAALVNSQPKHDKKDNDGPGKKKKKNN